MIVVDAYEFEMIKRVLDKKHLTRDEKGDETFTVVNIGKKKRGKRYAVREDKYNMYLAFMHKHFKITNEQGVPVNGLGEPLSQVRKKYLKSLEKNKK
jgi:hypothetical protein